MGQPQGLSSGLALSHDIEFADCDDLFANPGQLDQRFRFEEKGGQLRERERFLRLFQGGAGNCRSERERIATSDYSKPQLFGDVTVIVVEARSDVAQQMSELKLTCAVLHPLSIGGWSPAALDALTDLMIEQHAIVPAVQVDGLSQGRAQLPRPGPEDR